VAEVTLMVGPDAAHDAAPVKPGLGERELKYTLPAGRAGLARRWLEQLCRRDPQFPAAIVWTIYYDTAGLTSLGEKINSDYLKRKIRLRWYSALDGRSAGPAFVEAKIRTGTRRSKVREKVPYDAGELAAWQLQDPRLLSLPLLLQRHGVLGQESWQPMMLIRYRRDRFVEPVSRSRVSLDADIAAAGMSARFVSRADLSPIDRAVLEVKGMEEELPLAMRLLQPLGLRKQSFSKFLVAYVHATQRVL
jgi:hypothetical protein